MRLIKTLSVFIIMFYSIISFSQANLSLTQAINIAGKQRMLGQRMAKNKLFIKANKKTSIATKELQNTIIDFQKGLKILKNFAPTQAIKHKIAIQENIYNSYKKAILNKSKESLLEVANTNTLFLNICDDVVIELIKHSKSLPKNEANKSQNYVIDKIAEATGASGKLRYLTQRLTLYFALNEFGTQKVSPFELKEIISNLDENLNYLTILEFNTIDIDDALGQVTYYWGQLKDKLYQDGNIHMNSSKINAFTMYDLSNTILEKANNATKMYADLNK